MKNNTYKISAKIQGEEGKNPIEKLIQQYQIDTDTWYVDSFKIKDGKYQVAAAKRDQELKWELGRNKYGDTQIMSGYAKRYPEFIVHDNKAYSIEVIFKRLPIENNILESFQNIIKNMPTFPYKRRKPLFKPGSGHALELSTFDAHIGKLAWELETGYRNYDLNVSEEDYKYVSDDILEQSLSYEPEKIIIPIGQDLYHIDNMAGHTTSGVHSMDVDGRITKVNDVVFQVVLRSILKAREIAPVKIIWSPGNHDHFASFMLCFALKQYFKNDDLVEIDLSLPSFGKKIHKVEVWGTLLVGFTHRIVGKHNVWYNELSQAFPELWGKSKFREWHHGDQHKKQEVKTYPVVTSGGVILRQLTALSPVDRWHVENLFTDAVPGGEGYIWHKTKGIRCNFTCWTGQYEDNRNKLITEIY